MKCISGKAFARLLETHGWELKRTRGSHHLYTKQGVVDKVAVPIHGNKDLKIGLQRQLMKLAGISEEEL